MAKKILVTGAAGFIGFHAAKTLLDRGDVVVGIDSVSPYYDIRMKEARLALLKNYPNFSFAKLDIADYPVLEEFIKKSAFDDVVHLAAQAGVRYSMTNPLVYGEANLTGTLNIFEAARQAHMQRVIYASSSSVYGANEKQPFSEDDHVDTPLSLYAATKRADELIAYSYNHLFKMEMVGLRFFTVYGEWGRPDMALFKFVKRIMQDRPIDLYNNGNMKRSFTYVDDVNDAIIALIDQKSEQRNLLYNLGGDEAVPLMKFVELIEKELGKTAQKNLLPLQPGDVPETVADCSRAKQDLDYAPKVSIEEGIKRFVAWFKENEEFALSLQEPAQ